MFSSKPLIVLLGALATASGILAQVDVTKPIDFDGEIRPLVTKYCIRCHNADKAKSGVRLDRVRAVPEDRELFLLQEILEQITDEEMPPEDEPQPTPAERTRLRHWLRATIEAGRERSRGIHGTMRRLTIAQYRNTLRDLLGLREDITGTLPPDAPSKDGFLNDTDTLLLSPLLLEAYFDLAEKALDLSLVDVTSKPVIQNFRMDLGRKVNASPCPDRLILGANSHLLSNEDFVVTELVPPKSFDFEPFAMQRSFRFIEGYRGNDTVRGWREYDSIYHAVFACMRGNPGYPKGLAYQVVDEGLLLRPAIPSAEIFGVESTYGPRANFKISLRELPSGGLFRVTVRAAKYDDGLLLERRDAPRGDEPGQLTVPLANGLQVVQVRHAGVHQIDIHEAAVSDSRAKQNGTLTLRLGDRTFSSRRAHLPAFLVVRLTSGLLTVGVDRDGKPTAEKIVLTRLPDSDPLAARFLRFEKRGPQARCPCRAAPRLRKHAQSGGLAARGNESAAAGFRVRRCHQQLSPARRGEEQRQLPSGSA